MVSLTKWIIKFMISIHHQTLWWWELWIISHTLWWWVSYLALYKSRKASTTASELRDRSASKYSSTKWALNIKMWGVANECNSMKLSVLLNNKTLDFWFFLFDILHYAKILVPCQRDGDTYLNLATVIWNVWKCEMCEKWIT